MLLFGGAGSLNDMGNLISQFGIIGAAAGSLFVFKGVYKAVLINYPNPVEKDNLIRSFYLYNLPIGKCYVLSRQSAKIYFLQKIALLAHMNLTSGVTDEII